MKLVVHVIEARNLLAMDSNGLSDPYVKLQLGRQRAKTKVVKMSLNPSWDEEFAFRVGDLQEELCFYVFDEDKYFSDDFLGEVKVPLSKVMDAENFSLGTQWYPLQPKSKKAKIKDCGEICVRISLSQQNCSDETPSLAQYTSDDLTSNSDKSSELKKGVLLSNVNGETSSAFGADEVEIARPDKSNGPAFVNRLYQIFGKKNAEASLPHSKDPNCSENPNLQGASSTMSELSEKHEDQTCSDMSFEDLLKTFESQHQGVDMPEPLQGVLIDKTYAATPNELNSLLFSPSSNFLQALAEMQGSTGLQTGPWRLGNDGDTLKRTVSYTRAPTKLVKAIQATEEQSYMKADGQMYATLADVSTPDVPFGNCFRVEILTCIMPGPDLPTEGKSCRLSISWRVNFLQSTMMKSMIENGARQGLKENYAQFAELLAQYVRPVDLKETGGTKEDILASLHTEQESDWKLAFRIFGNFTVISTIFAFIYVIVHIMLSNPSIIQGLEFPGLDLPDSIGEVLVGGVLTLQGQRVLNMIARFMHARKKKGSDHGVKAQGDGWLLTVALIEGANLAAADSTGYSDPYVAFTCNGKTKKSSIKFRTLDPQWNEIFEFDAMDDPPSVMKIDVFDFDGPFDEVASLGHAEVNFLKSNLAELADIWIPLQGKLAQPCQSKLHLRVFLNNSKGTEVAKEYLDKMEKEVGTKIILRSPHTNSAFQKIFCLPPEEFLINDFTCHLKRKMPTQGRLFLSPRIIGFYTNLFGHKTKFFFLWEDIEDIQVLPPTLASMGGPSLLIILRKGRGLDAKHGAKALDTQGRLKFHFQSFVSFSVAQRTIMALWKARSLTPEQKVQLVEEESESKSLHSEGSGSFMGIEDAKMSEVFSSRIATDLSSVMEIFEGGSLERRVMEKMGCMKYSITPWEQVKADVYQRQVHYKIDKKLSHYEGEVTSTQQKSRLPDKNGWLIEEVMTLEGVPLGECLNLHIRYQLGDVVSKQKTCNIQVSVGIAWLKSSEHQKRITQEVTSIASSRVKKVFSLFEKEFAQAK